MSTPIILITGALSGIGRATAVAFAKASPLPKPEDALQDVFAP